MTIRVSLCKAAPINRVPPCLQNGLLLSSALTALLGLSLTSLLGCGITQPSTPAAGNTQQTGSTPAPAGVPATSFTFSVNSSTVLLTPGGAPQTIEISASEPNGSLGPINLTLSGLPPNVNAVPASLTVVPGVTRTVSLTAQTSAAIGTTQVTLSASSATMSLSTQVSLDIADPSGSIQSLPLPSSLHSLTGCTNPNTGTSNNDWGVGDAPVYADINGSEPQLGMPIYTSNTIFWISRENRPGQSVLMTGAFTDTPKTAKIAFIPPGTADWQSLVQASTTVVPTIQQGTTGLSFIIPSNFSSGIYAFEIDDPSAPPILGLANVPSMNWAVGVPAAIDPSSALQHQVYDCGAEPGENMRVFGKNFTSSDQVILQSASGSAYALTPSKLDTNSLTFVIPISLSPGIYNMWIGSSPWSATSSVASQITIYAPPYLTATTVACPSLIGDGTTDNTALLQSCLDENATAADSHEVVYIDIPSGTFLLTGGVMPHPNEVLIGTSPTASKFIGQPVGTPPKAWFTMPRYFGLANLSFEAPANPYLFVSSDSTTGNPETSGHLFIDNVNVQSTLDATNGLEQMLLVSGPDIQIYNSVFLSGSNQAFDVSLGDGGIVSGNQIILNNWTGLGVGDTQNLIFENNHIYSQNTPGQGANGMAAGSGMGISRENNQFGPSAVSQDIYIGYNTFNNMGAKGQQVITNDGGGGAYIGPIASSTANQVILAHDPAWNWMGTTNPQAAAIAVISGTGVGQYSFLKGWSGRTISLITPWKVLPDSTSMVVISQYELNTTIAHNTITNTLGTSIGLSDGLEGVVEDNVLTNSGDGILLAAYGPYGSPAAYGPLMNTDVLRNSIAVGTGNLITSSVNTNVGGIGIADLPGCLLSGLVIRDNTVPPINTMYSTDGMNQVNATLIEQNQGNWLPTFPIAGFLIQDNTPQ